MFQAGVPRLFTGNAATVQQWCNLRMKWSEAIHRKTVVYLINKLLVPDSWRNQNAAAENEPNDAMDVAKELREGAGSIFKDEPPQPSLAGRLLGVMQRMFGGSSSSTA